MYTFILKEWGYLYSYADRLHQQHFELNHSCTIILQLGQELGDHKKE
jgi:hypothetical protein